MTDFFKNIPAITYQGAGATSENVQRLVAALKTEIG